MKARRTSKPLFLIILVPLLLVVGIVAYFSYFGLPQTDSHNVDHVEPRFTGTVTEDGCTTYFGDIGCSIKVDNAAVQIEHGNMFTNTPWGSLLNADVTDNLLGKKVAVYADPVGTDNYTLAGSAAYYVKVLN